MAISPGTVQMNSRRDMKMLILQSFEAIGTSSPLMINTMVWPKGARIVDYTTADLAELLVQTMENRVFQGSNSAIGIIDVSGKVTEELVRKLAGLEHVIQVQASERDA